MRVAFLGTGRMGLPMARNLARAGHTVVAWNRTPERAAPLAADGVEIVASVADAVRGAEVAITMLADDRALGSVVFPPQGVAGALAEDAVHLGMSTVGASLSRRLAGRHAARGQRYVAAPVFGRPDAAEAARLKIVAAGDAEGIERCRPLFAALGDRVFELGPDAPAANVVKLCGNFVLASMIRALGEAFALARKSGVEAAALEEVLSGTLLGSPAFPAYARQMVEGRWDPPGMRMRLGLKDVRLVLAAADAAEVPMPLASLLRDSLLSGVARGRGDLDWAALAALVAEDAGL
ncbi:MAG TPA: NAD(P)-dependent oxidoreductase [Longimicrobium sp.]